MEPLKPGTVIGDRYVVGGVLGSGGFGTVYDAQHKFMKRRVAVKLLDRVATKADGGVAQRRFLREAESAARIEHPNVVGIYDFGFFGPREIPYIAMQFLEGRDLREELTEAGAFPPHRALTLMMGALDGLAEAHAQDIVHKDLKPNNLIIVGADTDRESMRVVDFGLAVFSENESEDSRLTKSGNVLGTPRYLPPEYIRNQAVSPQLDVYQMGLILVEMLTGEPVVNGDTMYNNILAHVGGQLEIPMAFVDSPLGPILRRALAYEVSKRYPDAGVFRTALSRLDPASIPVVTAASPKIPLRDASDETIPPFDLQEFTSDTALVGPPARPEPAQQGRGLGLVLAGAVAGAVLVGGLGVAIAVGMGMSASPEPEAAPSVHAPAGEEAAAALERPTDLPSAPESDPTPPTDTAAPGTAAEGQAAAPTTENDAPTAPKAASGTAAPAADATPESAAAPKSTATPAKARKRPKKKRARRDAPPAPKKTTSKRLKVVD